MMIVDDLENRVRELSNEVEIEKLVTRRVYDQAIRNGDQIGALRSEVGTARVDIQALTSQAEYIVGEIVLCTASFRSQGTRLDSLTRDISLLRNEVTALRRGQEELHARIDPIEARLHALRVDIDALRAGQDALRTEIDALRAGQEALRAEIDALRTGQEALRTGQEAMRVEIDALRVGQEALHTGQEALRVGQMALHEEINRKLDLLIAVARGGSHPAGH
jgi:chromosome segregation ATPase